MSDLNSWKCDINNINNSIKVDANNNNINSTSKCTKPSQGLEMQAFQVSK